MAIGAGPAAIARMIGGRSLALVAFGVGAGLIAAWQIAPAMRSLLYDVPPSDPRSLAAAAVFVLAVSALATAVPALRAMRIQPAAALRDEGI
jgi:ABC-type antimicrobial peptide transport system permease subunit